MVKMLVLLDLLPEVFNLTTFFLVFIRPIVVTEVKNIFAVNRARSIHSKYTIIYCNYKNNPRKYLNNR